MDRRDQFFTRKPLGLFASFFRPHLKLFFCDLICAFGIALINLAFPLLTRFGLTELIPQHRFMGFIWLMIALLIAFIIQAGLQYVVTYWGHLLGVRMEADMRSWMFRHMQTLSFRFYDQNRTGSLMSRVVNDLNEIAELAHHGPEDLFIAGITLIGAFIAMLCISWELALVLIVLVPIILLVSIQGRRHMAKASSRVKQVISDINTEVESSISGVRVAQAFSNQHHEVKKFNRQNDFYQEAKKGFYKAMARFSAKMEFWTALLNLVVIGLGGLMMIHGRLTLADMLTFTLFVNAFLTPIRKLMSFFELFANGMAGFDRFVQIMKENPDVADQPDAIECQNLKGDITFDDVSFAYQSTSDVDEDTAVLSHLNLQVEAGKTLALVGPSGGGKTTLCQLIPRFYDVTAGAIRIDGQDIRSFKLLSLRKQIGIVQQDVFLFATSIRDNIRYGQPDATDEAVVEAAKQADIHDFIMSLPEGYDTLVGERGVRLSGGQKQRLSIARIFLKNPPILILDEATSALDTATEYRVQQALERLAKGRTCLIIAHRLSTIKHADEIIYIDAQGVRERGTHAALLAQKGAYYDLCQAQFGQWLQTD